MNRHKTYCATVACTRRGSMRHTLPASRFDSHTEPSPTRTASPPLPANCWTTLLVDGSIRDSGKSNDVTQTEPSPTAMSPPPPGTPTSMVATTLLVFGSIRATVPFVSITIQTLPAPVAIDPSELPIGVAIVAVTAWVVKSTRAIVLAPQLGTQRLPKPIASPEHGRAPAPSAIVAA